MAQLSDAGFAQVGIELTQHPMTPKGAGAGSGRVASAFVRANKPLATTLPADAVPVAAASCCGSSNTDCRCG